MKTQRYKIVMLPTQKADLPNGIVKYLPTGKLSYSKSPVYSCDITEKWEMQHLYIVDTQSPIEAVDWFYCFKYKDVFKNQKHNQTDITDFKIIASTNSSLGLQPIPQYIIDAYIADNTIELSIDNAGNFCYDAKPTSEDLEIEMNNFVNKVFGANDFYAENNLPKTVEEFIKELNRHCSDWEYIGKDPFKAMYNGNTRLETALRRMALSLFGDDDLVELEDLFNECLDNIISDNELQVDFDLLKDYINNNLVSSSHSPEYQAKLANVRLFFELEEVKKIIERN